MTRVAHVTRADIEPMSAMLARAFADDPVQQWLFAEADHYLGALADFLGFFAERYFRLGHTYGSASVEGASLWAPPDLHSLGEADIGPLLELLQRHVGDVAEARMMELGRTIEFLPAEPHVYLGIIGVDPSARGLGMGTALMAPGLRMADEGGFAVHLESSNPRNLSLYLRHGFEPIGEFTCGGPDGPVMTPMRREPIGR